MTSYFELLKNPAWEKRRREVLDRASFECERCGARDKALHVHQGYYEKGKKPWEYPEDALTCLCEDCRMAAEDLRLQTDKLLSKVGREDEVYGYTLGALAFDERDLMFSVPNYEIALGVADYWGLNVEETLIPHLIEKDKKTCGRCLLEIVANVGSPTKPWLQRIARSRRNR